MEAAQLTKLIYRRAHEQRHHRGKLLRGVSSIQAQPAHMSKSPVDYISLRDQYNDARTELRKAELLKREIQIITGYVSSVICYIRCSINSEILLFGKELF